MRSLANSAQMLQDNPGLWKLHLLEAMQQPTGNIFVVNTNEHTR